MIVYIPPCDSSPLRLYNSNVRDTGKNGNNGSNGSGINNSTIQSFLSSKWGGIIISNPTADECSNWMSNQEKVEVTVNSHNVMHTALFLLRRIIDVHIDVSMQLVSAFSQSKNPKSKFGIYIRDYDSKSFII